MKSIKELKPASTAAPHEIVRLYLDIQQCRYIHALLSEKLEELNTKCLEDINMALEQLINSFEKNAYPKESITLHKDESFDEYIESLNPDGLNRFLSAIHIEGALHVE